MGRVGALCSTGLHPPALPTVREQPIEETALGPMSQHTTPTFGEDREIKATLSQIQAKDIVPTDAGAHCINCLPIRQSLCILHRGDQREPPGCFGGLSSAGKRILKILIRIHSSSLITHLEKNGAFGQDGMRDARGLFGNGGERFWVHGQWLSPACLFALIPLQSLIFFLGSSGRMHQHYLRGALPFTPKTASLRTGLFKGRVLSRHPLAGGFSPATELLAAYRAAAAAARLSTMIL